MLDAAPMDNNLRPLVFIYLESTGREGLEVFGDLEIQC